MIDFTYIVKKRVYRKGRCVSIKRVACTSSYISACKRMCEVAFSVRDAGEMYAYISDNIIVTICDDILTYFSVTYESICIPY